MEVIKTTVTIRELTDGYTIDKESNGVVGYGGKLDIRPAYQREFVYSEEKQKAVIDSVTHGFPISIMYWAVRDDDSFEVLDGQQRTLSICEYVAGRFPYNGQFFYNLDSEDQKIILDYELEIHQCKGTSKEKLAWFQRINIASETLTNQELRNAVYAGPWLSDAKKKFSSNTCVAYHEASDYIKGNPIRQDLLEIALSWMADRDGITIEELMAKSQHKSTAKDLWIYFDSVIEWVKANFITYYRDMKGLPWGIWFNKYGNDDLDPVAIDKRIKELRADDELTSTKGIYEYILTGEENKLKLRTFGNDIRRRVYRAQDGICPHCKTEGVLTVWPIEEMEADHITPWREGGTTTEDNCQMLCRRHNRIKGGR